MAILKRALTCLFLMASLCLFLRPAAAEQIQLQESQIKAGLLYNFLKYTDWPDGADGGAIQVCVFGGDPFSGYLSSLEKLTVQRRAINVRYIGTIADSASCNLVFINENAREAWPDIRTEALKHHILTVSDFGGFAKSGGIIEFGNKDDHISASLNTAAAAAAGLKIGDRLLRLVSIVDYPVPGAAP